MSIVQFARIVPLLSLIMVAIHANAAERHLSSSSSYSFSNSSSWSTYGNQPTGQRYQTGAGFLKVQNASLIATLNMVNQAGPAKVVVGAAAAKVIQNSNKLLTLSKSYDSQEQLLHIVLDGLDLRVENKGSRLMVLSTVDTAANLDFTPISRLAIEDALRRPVTIHLEAPLQVAIQVLEGSTGIRISHAYGNIEWSYIWPRVIIHSNGRPLSEVLASVARQIDGEIHVAADRIELRPRRLGPEEADR